ncbi:MAG: hypothetical protein WCF65_06080 [Parachlamydiaceae bacterium]
MLVSNITDSVTSLPKFVTSLPLLASGRLLYLEADELKCTHDRWSSFKIYAKECFSNLFHRGSSNVVTDRCVVELKFIEELVENRGSINSESLKSIKQVAEKVGLVEAKPKTVDKHLLLSNIIGMIGFGVFKDMSLIGMTQRVRGFETQHYKELESYGPIVTQIFAHFNKLKSVPASTPLQPNPIPTSSAPAPEVTVTRGTVATPDQMERNRFAEQVHSLKERFALVKQQLQEGASPSESRKPAQSDLEKISNTLTMSSAAMQIEATEKYFKDVEKKLMNLTKDHMLGMDSWVEKGEENVSSLEKIGKIEKSK